jgi:hypothetical protein
MRETCSTMENEDCLCYLDAVREKKTAGENCMQMEEWYRNAP